MKKARFITLFMLSIVLFGNVNSYAKDLVVPNAQVCQVYSAYGESNVINSRDIQFTHMAYKSPITSSVTRTVTLTESLTLKAGASADLNFLIGGTKVDFELSKASSRQTSTSITWNVPAGANYKLIAGKERAEVRGYIATKNSDCTLTKRNITVEGTLRTYHTAVKE